MSGFKLLPKAENDLETIWLYTESKWGINQAHDYLDGLIGVFQLLSENPLMCRERKEFTPPVHIHHHAHHLIIFIISGEQINIIRVLHESMDIDAQLDS